MVKGSEDVVGGIAGGEFDGMGMVKVEGREEDDFDLPVTSLMRDQVFLEFSIALLKQSKK